MFWWFILISDLLIPITIIIAGKILYSRPPKNINALAGYRTVRSMKNMDTWVFANRHCGKIWQKSGLIMLLPTVLAHLPFYRSNDDIIGTISLIVIAVQLVVMVASIFLTEKSLKDTFDDEGNRK
ncbi:MAG: SdpI family protein [Oscillospiraceae bacterium]|nr:SdpI family protein [Oscillospiraceae bacterium]